jgi:hypothetical protein
MPPLGDLFQTEKGPDVAVRAKVSNGIFFLNLFS